MPPNNARMYRAAALDICWKCMMRSLSKMELANRMDQSQGTGIAEQSEISTNTQLEISDLKAKVLRMTEKNTQHDGV